MTWPIKLARNQLGIGLSPDRITLRCIRSLPVDAIRDAIATIGRNATETGARWDGSTFVDVPLSARFMIPYTLGTRERSRSSVRQ